MADVIFFLFLLPLLSAASPPSTPPPIQPLTTPPLPKPSPPPIQATTPQTQIKPYPPPSPPQQQPTLVKSPPYQPQEPLPIQNPPPAPRTEDRQERMKNILEALIGSGDFANWGNLLTTADPSLLPFTSTLFVPNNDVVLSSIPSSSSSTGVNAGIDPFLFLYHIVPQRLTFNDLCLFTAPNTRLPTLLPTKSILITNASKDHFSIDGSRVTDPDLYSTDSVVVHGIGGLLDYQFYGGDGTVASFPWMNQNQSQNQGVAPMKGVGGVVVQSSKGGILRIGFTALLSLSLGLTMIW